MRQTTPPPPPCTPEKKAMHAELRHQANEKKRLMDETDYEYSKGTIDAIERTKRYTQIVLEYGEILKRMHNVTK